MEYSSIICVCLIFFQGFIYVIHLWQEYHRSDAVFFLLHFMRWHMISICPITQNIYID